MRRIGPHFPDGKSHHQFQADDLVRLGVANLDNMTTPRTFGLLWPDLAAPRGDTRSSRLVGGLFWLQRRYSEFINGLLAAKGPKTRAMAVTKNDKIQHAAQETVTVAKMVTREHQRQKRE